MSKERFNRFVEAYEMMAREGRYRPAAPGDGVGGISLAATELADPERLHREAQKYAQDFYAADNKMEHHTGCSNFSTNRAFVFVIEAARLLCSGSDGNPYALKLLEMATREIKAADAQQRVNR